MVQCVVGFATAEIVVISSKYPNQEESHENHRLRPPLFLSSVAANVARDSPQKHMSNVACDLCAATKTYARNSVATISVRADLAGAFKRCCIRSGRYDGSERKYFFPRIDTKKERRYAAPFLHFVA